MASATGSPMPDGSRRRGPPWGPGPPPWVTQGGGYRGGPRRFMRRVALMFAAFLLLLFAAVVLSAIAVASALGDASAAAGVGGAVVGVVLVAVVVWLVGRTVRRTLGPIGDVMEAAERVAGGDYAARVDPGGPGEVRRLGRTFNDMTARLEAAEDQRRRLLADVAHELGTPLSIVRGNVEGMLDGVYDADREHLTTILEETDLMARLLDDLRTLSTAEAGALRLHREPTDLAARAADVVTAFRPRASAKGIRLEQRADGYAEAEVDGARIRQVIENLLANALRHTPSGGLVAIQVAGDHEAVELAVTDTGPGIPEDQLTGVFDRYTRSADSGGSGLGLAIARSLVEAHGGVIRAESPAGGGTTIRVRLPSS
jgi:two-component system, OmpR family, sensor histidine kinase BaeS